MLLAIVPLPFALSLSLLPSFGEGSLISIFLVFLFGLLVGTITHIYWIRVLLKEREFYKNFYDTHVAKPHVNEKEVHKKHTRMLMPFYAMSIMMFLIVIFVFGIFDLGFSFALPLILGAMQGIPISYLLMEKGIFS
jgi:hypothetical protein